MLNKIKSFYKKIKLKKTITKVYKSSNINLGYITVNRVSTNEEVRKNLKQYVEDCYAINLKSFDEGLNEFYSTKISTPRFKQSIVNLLILNNISVEDILEAKKDLVILNQDEMESFLQGIAIPNPSELVLLLFLIL